MSVEHDREEWQRREDANRDAKCRETFAVVDATHEEAHGLWYRWHYRLDAGMRVPAWEEISIGFWTQIGEFGGAPVCASVSWARVDGRLVAFVEGTSMVVHHGMIEKWCKEKFPNARSHSNAANFHNVVLDIGRANDAAAKRT